MPAGSAEANKAKSPEDVRVAELKAQDARDNVLRAKLGVSAESLSQYDPENAVEKIGKKWGYKTIEDNPSQILYPTKAAAIEAATQHKALKQEMYDNPDGFRSGASLSPSGEKATVTAVPHKEIQPTVTPQGDVIQGKEGTEPPKTGKLDQLEMWATQRLAEKDAAERAGLAKAKELRTDVAGGVALARSILRQSS